VRTLICQSKSEHIIRDDDMADVNGRTLTIVGKGRICTAAAPAKAGKLFSARFAATSGAFGQEFADDHEIVGEYRSADK
jgi:hypothetical protein